MIGFVRVVLPINKSSLFKKPTSKSALCIINGSLLIKFKNPSQWSAKLFLSTVKTDIIPTQGTENAKAINLSIESFDMENTQDKAIVIITDGESHDENAIENAKKANELGIIVHTLGMGLSKGGPIPIYNKYGNKIVFRKNKEGNTIVTKLNEDLLMKIANAGDGTYVRANNSKTGLSKLFAALEGIAGQN